LHNAEIKHVNHVKKLMFIQRVIFLECVNERGRRESDGDDVCLLYSETCMN